MAQTIKLKRSATTGKVPSTSNLALGELAVNTYDGRIFFKKNDGSDSIEHIVTTDSITTGSITLTQTGSFGQIEIDSGGTNSQLHLKTSNTHYRLIADSGEFRVQDITDAITPLLIDTSGKVGISVNGTANAALHVHTETPSDGVLILSDGSGNLLEVDDTGLKVAGNISGSSFNGTGLISGSSQVDRLVYDNDAVKIQATNTGVTVSGDLGISQNERIDLGTDFKLYETSTAAYIQYGSNPLLFNGNGDVIFRKMGSEEKTAVFTPQGSAKLYYNDSLKLETTTNGIAITGNISGSSFNGTGLLSGSIAGQLPSGVISGSSQIDHDATTNFVANEHIDHSTITIGSGKGLSGGGTITTSRSLTLDTGSAHFTEGVDNRLVSLNSFTSSLSSADISDVDAFSQSGTYSGLRAQSTTKGDVGLGNVTNESKSTMFTNAALTGTPTAPTADAADDSTQIATTEFVKSQNYITSADGGNAQTLDSIDSSGFIRANANDDVSAHTEWQDSKEIRLGTDNDAQLYHNGTNMFLANGTGNLIIRNNTNDGNVVLQSDDGSGGVASYLYLDGTNGKVQIEKPTDISDTTQSDAKTTGAFVVDGGVGIAKTLNVGEDVVAYASSDERYKDNVTPIENPNEKLKQIGGYTFDWNDKHEVFKGQHDVGVIAQEIEKVLPEIVETRESGYKAVKYEKIVALLIESNKELLKRVEELESKIK